MWSTSINDEINVQKATLQIRAWVEMLISWVKNTRDERNPMQACTRLSEIARNTCDSENFDLNTMWSPTKAADAMASVRISLACFMVMFLALYGPFSKFYEHILGCRMPPDCCLFCVVGSVRSNTTIIKFPNLLFYVVFLFATRIHALLDLDGLNFKINISLFIVTNKVQRNALECCINV